ncbi:tRNA dihydrouridine(20/20a) synthase DusA [Alkalisalibacterium limincola]|uniref:tRNA-dihydrouridine(20/20a) synthase n=1 Tax=Alkalisalibacterium limincola TaxID=2699169 RepID=A0A5C8KK13_9GAMM|nr:tRNA dihydrouridine(20/20a) synthase DusA [Alkalisalibacterium limincola]TXK59823.1 tRNA dihydrouridine(20/20a) synthase DusA [Alkalisalibacterium limincola]
MVTLPANALRLCVAPMMEWTDRHCRVFHRILAPGARLYTEMVHAQAVIHGDRQRLLGFDPVEHPLALQLGGSDPSDLARACVVATGLGYDEINLNVGCPSDRVQAGRFGACLMREPGLVADCVAAMASATPVPVTVKCRLGVDELEDYDYFLGFIDTVAQAGCRVFIVHARKAWLSGLSPKQNREIPPLRHDWVWRLKRERPELQVVLNGGLTTPADAQAHLPHCDGVMIGRAAYHDPYVLHRLQQALFAPEQPLRPREALLGDMRPYIEAHLAAGGALKHVARHLLGLFHGEFGGRAFRQVLSQNAYREGAGWEVIEQALEPTRRQPREAA